MKKLSKKMILLIVCLMTVCFFSGCVHHTALNPVRPSAVPEKYITKTALPGVYDPAADSEDPWVRCKNSGTEDGDLQISSVSKLTPEEFRRRVQISLNIQDSEASTAVVVTRCMNGGTYVCHVTDNGGCMEKVDFSAEPNEKMKAACQESALEGAILPDALTGVNNAYQWTCQDGVPVISQLILSPDAAGYNADIWREIPAP